MDLFEQISEDIKSAMKSREKEKLEALRGIKKVLLEAKTAAGSTGELSEQEILKIIQKLAKQGKEGSVQIGAAPFARAGVFIKIKESIPVLLLDVRPGEPANSQSIGEGVAPFTADGFALPRG